MLLVVCWTFKSLCIWGLNECQRKLSELDCFAKDIYACSWGNLDDWRQRKSSPPLVLPVNSYRKGCCILSFAWNRGSKMKYSYDNGLKFFRWTSWVTCSKLEKWLKLRSFFPLSTFTMFPNSIFKLGSASVYWMELSLM